MKILRSMCRDRVVGVDFSRGMLEICREKEGGFPGRPDVLRVRADALRMPFNEAFDLAVCFGGLGHFLRRDHTRLVDQVARALAPGGRFVFLSAMRPPILSARYWAARGFNAVMRLRNALIRPPFVMYYMRFLLPEAAELLEARGFSVTTFPVHGEGPSSDLRLVIGTLPHNVVESGNPQSTSRGNPWPGDSTERLSGPA
jgi:SAM-dependent methyltransferase